MSNLLTLNNSPIVLQKEGGGGNGYSITFPSSAANWNQVLAVYLLLSDGSSLDITNFSVVAGKKIDNVVGLKCVNDKANYDLKISLTKGAIVRLVMSNSPDRPVFNIVRSGETSPTALNSNSLEFIWWPLAEIVISSIEMYYTD